MNASLKVGTRKKIKQNFPLHQILQKLAGCSDGWQKNNSKCHLPLWMFCEVTRQDCVKLSSRYLHFSREGNE